MLLPDSIHPRHSIYYTGAMILQVIQQNEMITIADLFVQMKQEHDMSFKLLLLSLDWLYLIHAASINEKGEVRLCS